MRNFGNFAAFGVLRMTGSGQYELNFWTIQRPVNMDLVIRSVPSPPGHYPPTTRETNAGNPLSWKYVLNPSRDRVESRSEDHGSTLESGVGAFLSSSSWDSRHGLCSYIVAEGEIQSFVSVTNEERVA